MNALWQKVLAAYPQEKRDWDRTFPWIAYVVRPVSLFLTPVFYRAGFSANFVTVLSYISAAAGLWLMAVGSVGWGAALFILFNLLDCIDGNLARLSGVGGGSVVGEFYDAVGDFFWKLPYMFLGLGIARCQASGAGFSNLYLAAGVAATTLKFMTASIRESYWTTLGEAWTKHKSSQRRSVAHAGRWYYRLYYNLTDLQGQDGLMWLLIVIGRGPQFLIASALIMAAEFIGVLFIELRRAHAIQRRPG